MKVALIGYAQSGRSSLYRAAARGLAKGDVTAVPVPDPRFDAIVAQVKPKKQTPATVIVQDDVEAVASQGRALTVKLIDSAKKADLLLVVARGFQNPAVMHHLDTIDAVRDADALETELIIADLGIVENRLERLLRSNTVKTPGSPDYMDKQALDRFKSALEDGTPIRHLDLTEDEEATVRSYQFLSAKPTVIAVNLGEDDAATPPPAVAAALTRWASKGTPAFAVCATIEEEIAQLDPADQPEFLESLGLTEPAGNRMIRAVYDAMGLITFFTAGENDTHAWPLRRGSSALKAAATIHNDIAKGFIRAEIVHYDDYVAAGSLDAAYSAGKMSLEGKDYVIRDGDLIHIRNKS